MGSLSVFFWKKFVFKTCILTEFLGMLFGDASHPGFSSLWCLKLQDSKLNSTDLASINLAASLGKLPVLKALHLPDNVLTNSLAHLVGHSNLLGYPSLQRLNLSNTRKVNQVH